MRASVLSSVRHLEVRDVPFPRVAPHEVLVRVGAVGLCGTDAHIFAGDANYNTDEYGQPIPLEVQPQTLGHEISGYVEEAGSEVHDLKSGDRVVVDQGLRILSHRRFASMRVLRGTRHHRTARRTGRVHRGAGSERDSYSQRTKYD